MHAELYNFFRASFSAQQFRRWIRQLPPDGATLAQALPDGDVAALTLFDVGADLLIRNNYVDAAFFAALTREFPLKADEVADLAARCSPRATPTTVTTRRPTRLAASALVLTAVLGLGGALARHLWPPSQVAPSQPISTPPPVEPQQPLAPTTNGMTVSPLPLAPPAAEPGLTATAVGPTAAEKPVDAKPPTSKTDHRGKSDIKKVVTREPPPLGPFPPTPVPCTVSDKVRGDLGALARALLTGEGVTEEFTVTLPEGATEPNVSPPPGAGQSVRKQLHARLQALGPAELGRCRDIPIDVEFTKSKTTLSPRLH